MMEQRLATKRQLWALYCITKKDYRSSGISFDEASKIIAESQENANYTKKNKVEKITSKKILDWLKKDENLKKEILAQFNIESVIVHEDIFGNKDKTKPVYNFVGVGCGFSWFVFDKRNKTLKYLNDNYDIISDARLNFIDWAAKTFFTKAQRDNYEKRGTPVGAVLFQDMNINIAVNHAIADYLVEELGVKRSAIDVRYRLD